MKTRLAVLLATAALTASAPTSAADSVPTVPLDRGWEYRFLSEEWDGEAPPSTPDSPGALWRSLEYVPSREVARAGQVWLRVPLPAAELEEPGLYFWSNRAIFVLYLDEMPIYRFGRHRAGSARPGVTWHFVPLPEKSEGKTLHLWGPRPVPGSISPLNWILVPRALLGQLVTLRLKRVVLDDLDNLLFGAVLFVVGLAAVAIYFFRGTRRDLAPFYFGAFALLYGVRLLAQSDLIELATDLYPRLWNHVAVFSTYAINVPSTLFLEQFYGRGWKSTIRRLWQLQLAYAVVAIAVDLYTGETATAMPVNAYLVLLGMVVALGHVFRPQVKGIPEAPVFKVSFLILAVFVVNENLVSASLVPWSASFEEIGFFVFLCGLGYALVRRVSAKEKQLATVEQELETARQIQSSILPERMPEIRGLQLAVRYEPVAFVAGDFYDFFKASERQLGILVADVAGHGVPAALIASMVKVSFSSQASIAADPARVLLEMNRTLYGSLKRRFVTAGYLFLDTSKNEAVYASGGHPPPLIWRESRRKVEELPGRGPILGRFADAEYSASVFSLGAGDRIYLFTDGILEATSTDGEQFGESRFRQFIESNYELAPRRFVNSFFEHLGGWTSKQAQPEREDDLTLLALEFSGE